MTSVDRVSVIVPFHNPGPYLREAIQSVLEQSYTNWELLLVDDGSTDGNAGTALEFARLHPERIFYLRSEGIAPRGCSHARNVGLRRATGSYVASLDADDVWLPTKLEEQVLLLREHPAADILYGRTIYWYSWQDSASEADDFIPELGFESGSIIEPPTVLEAALEGAAPLPCTCSLIVRRNLAERVGGHDESFPLMFEDQVFYTKLFVEASTLVVDRVWDRYRQHDRSGSVVASSSGILHRERLRYLDWTATYLATHGLRSSPAWWLVQQTRLSLRYPRAARLVHRGARLARAAVDLLRRRSQHVERTSR